MLICTLCNSKVYYCTIINGVIIFIYRKERRHSVWIQLHRSNVCTNLPNLLLRSSPTPTSTDPPYHQHPPSPHPSPGTSDASSTSYASYGSSSGHCSQPTARLGIRSTSTTMPLPHACSTTNRGSCPTPTLPTPMLSLSPRVRTILPTYVLQETIRIRL